MSVHFSNLYGIFKTTKRFKSSPGRFTTAGRFLSIFADCHFRQKIRWKRRRSADQGQHRPLTTDRIILLTPHGKGGEKMKVTPDDYGRRCQFDHFCKLVLYHEAVDYFRERKRQRGWETSFETLPLSELDTLCTIDQYPSDSFIFPAYGCELQISDGLVAAAFASLPQPGQSILILHCVLELTDGEIGAVVGMSRSAVQRHRTKTLETMRTRLTGGIAE